MMRGSAAARRSNQDQAVLGKGLRVRGRVVGDGDLRIEAVIEGDVSVSGELSLDATGSISGTAEAQSLVISGELVGDAHAPHGSVSITSSGQVRGNIVAATLSIDEGAQLDGQVEAEFDLPEPLLG